MDCLVTKLKGTVNDNSLLPLGGMFLKAISNPSVSNDERSIVLQSTKAQTITVVGGANNLTINPDLSTGLTSSLEIPANSAFTFYAKDGEYNILIPDKYSISRIGDRNNSMKNIKLNLKDLKYCGELRVLCPNTSSIVEGDLSELSGMTLSYVSVGNMVTGDIKVIDEINWVEGNTYPETFYVMGQNITGNIATLTGSTILKQLGFNSQVGIVGTLAQIAEKFPNLTMLDIPNSKITGDIKDITCPLTTMNVMNCPGISGKLEEFVATQRSHGRNTGSCSSNHTLSNVTLNGVPLTDKNFSWTETQITCGNTTITA